MVVAETSALDGYDFRYARILFVCNPKRSFATMARRDSPLERSSLRLITPYAADFQCCASLRPPSFLIVRESYFRSLTGVAVVTFRTFF